MADEVLNAHPLYPVPSAQFGGVDPVAPRGQFRHDPRPLILPQSAPAGDLLQGSKTAQTQAAFAVDGAHHDARRGDRLGRAAGRGRGAQYDIFIKNTPVTDLKICTLRKDGYLGHRRETTDGEIPRYDASLFIVLRKETPR